MGRGCTTVSNSILYRGSDVVAEIKEITIEDLDNRCSETSSYPRVRCNFPRDHTGPHIADLDENTWVGWGQ